MEICMNHNYCFFLTKLIPNIYLRVPYEFVNANLFSRYEYVCSSKSSPEKNLVLFQYRLIRVMTSVLIFFRIELDLSYISISDFL